MSYKAPRKGSGSSATSSSFDTLPADLSAALPENLGLDAARSWLTPPRTPLREPSLIPEENLAKLTEYFGPLFEGRLGAISKPARFIFYGEVAAGKSTAICSLVARLAGLAPILPPPVQGLCTPFTYEFLLRAEAPGVEVRLELESAHELRKNIELARESLHGEAGAEGAELSRAVKNLFVAFCEHYRRDCPVPEEDKDLDRWLKRIDPNTWEEFENEMVSRQTEANAILSPPRDCVNISAWLANQIGLIDSQYFSWDQRVPFPKKVVITLPRVEGSVDCDFVDTVGLKPPKTPKANKRNVNHLRRLEPVAKENSVILLCTRFSAVPSNSLGELCDQLASGNRASLGNRCALLSLVQQGIHGAEDSLVRASRGAYKPPLVAREYYSDLIRTCLKEKVAIFATVPTLAFNAKRLGVDEARQEIDSFLAKIFALADNLRMHYSIYTSECNAMLGEEFQLFRSTRFLPWLASFYESIKAKVEKVNSSIQTNFETELKSYHASTIRASVRRSGEFHNLNMGEVLEDSIRDVLVAKAKAKAKKRLVPISTTEDGLRHRSELLASLEQSLKLDYHDICAWKSISDKVWKLCSSYWGEGKVRGLGFSARVGQTLLQHLDTTADLPIIVDKWQTAFTTSTSTSTSS